MSEIGEHPVRRAAVAAHARFHRIVIAALLQLEEQRAGDLPVLARAGEIAASLRKVPEREPGSRVGLLVLEACRAADALAQEIFGIGRSFRLDAAVRQGK